jgi:tetratricopeptide (TPR) repeat protein
MASSARRLRERKLQAVEGYLELNMPDRALRELDEIPDPEVFPFEFHRAKGEVLRAAERFEPALTAYSRALAEKPEDLSVLMGMAWCYKRTDQLPRAIAAMEQAYRAHPRQPIILYNLACYHSLAANKPQALSWLGRALRLAASQQLEPDLRKLIPDETDFDLLRHDPDFQYVVGITESIDN